LRGATLKYDRTWRRYFLKGSQLTVDCWQLLLVMGY
jgi:hypothetical protein